MHSRSTMLEKNCFIRNEFENRMIFMCERYLKLCILISRRQK